MPYSPRRPHPGGLTDISVTYEMFSTDLGVMVSFEQIRDHFKYGGRLARVVTPEERITLAIAKADQLIAEHERRLFLNHPLVVQHYGVAA